MGAARLNWTIEQGTDFSRQLTFKDKNDAIAPQTGATWSGKIRSSFTSSTVLASFSFDTTQADTGIIVVSLANTTTSGLPSTVGTDKLVYDIEKTLSSKVSRVLEGKIKVKPEVTK